MSAAAMYSSRHPESDNNLRPSSQDRANACEAVGHEADQRTVAQTHKIGFLRYAVLIRRLFDPNAVEERAGLVGGEDRRFNPS
jgi:hypothetical protein